MRHSLVAVVLAALVSACSTASDPAVPIASGEYAFEHRFAEHPAIRSIQLQVKIAGSRIVVTNLVASDPFPAGTLAEGQLMWHAASRQWIIGQDEADRTAPDVGGCSDGPEVVDLAGRIYWTC